MGVHAGILAGHEGTNGRVLKRLSKLQEILKASGDAHLDRRTNCRLRSDLSVTPGQEFIKTSNLVVGNAAENVGEPGLFSNDQISNIRGYHAAKAEARHRNIYVADQTHL